MNENNEKGYMTIVTALIVTSLAIVIASTLSMGNFLGRLNTQFIEMKKISRSVAEGCIEHARLELAKGNYSGDETIRIGSFDCHIYSIQDKGSTKIIQASSTVEGKNTSLEMSINSDDLKVNYIDEKVSF